MREEEFFFRRNIDKYFVSNLILEELGLNGVIKEF